MNKQKNSILAVDDNLMQIKTLTLMLGQDYIVYSAKSGEKAIELAKKHSPDLILLDILMPGLSGYETLSILKADPQTKNIPVIFITGLNNEQDQLKGLKCDVVDYITKPFNKEIVMIRVQNHLKVINGLRNIKHLSMTDQLTNIPNRRYFTDRMEAEWKLCARNKRPISLLLLDIDHFKIYNDTYGHPQGDIAIAEVARIISQTLNRPSDFAARYGGEEFVVLLPDTNEIGALDVAERIRRNIENTPIQLHDEEQKPTYITVSVGVNTTIPETSDLYDTFVSQADYSLYKSKKDGRNRVTAYKAAN